jgi:hypothetical protein
MKGKSILCGALAAVVLAGSAGAQSSFEPAVRKAKPAFSGVKLVSVTNGSGKQILVLSGQKSTFPVTFVKTTTPLSGQTFQASTKSAKGTTVLTSSVVVPPAAPVLKPGQVVLIGPTGTTTAVGRTDTLVVRAPATRATGLSANPLAATVERQVFTGDLPRDTTGISGSLTLGAVAGATPEVAIGPNGFPTFAGTTAPQSGTNAIGPNGFPEPATTGPQGGIQPVSPNGFSAPNAAPVAQSAVTRAGMSRVSTAPATGTAPITSSGASAATTIAVSPR